MSALSTIHTAQHDVAKAQSALDSVQTDLDMADTAAETVDGARRWLHKTTKLVLLAIVISVIVAIILSKRSKTAEHSIES